MEVNIFYNILKYSTILLTSLTLTVNVCESEELRCEILQYKLDRLYFSAGEEADIFSHSGFKIVCGSDTLYQGRIDRSFAGVSYSDTTGGLFDSVDSVSCYALIETATGDSLADLHIRFQNMDDNEIKLILPENIFTEPNSFDTIITENGRRIFISQLNDLNSAMGYQATDIADIIFAA